MSKVSHESKSILKWWHVAMAKNKSLINLTIKVFEEITPTIEFNEMISTLKKYRMQSI